MSEPKYCKDCRYSFSKPDSKYDLRCNNPYVNADCPYSLGSSEVSGVSCTSERGGNWRSPCGKRGAEFEAKE